MEVTVDDVNLITKIIMNRGHCEILCGCTNSGNCKLRDESKAKVKEKKSISGCARKGEDLRSDVIVKLLKCNNYNPKNEL